ncbi:MAG: UDP-glucose 4-epimerase GalE [Candidatus Saccharimonadales bacterium]
MNVLVTGGAGYIGSHTIVELYAAGHTVIVVDNLINSSRESIRRVEKIVNAAIPFYERDVCDKSAMTDIFDKNNIDAVIHFAGLKAVGDSVEKPFDYYHNNIVSSLILLETMKKSEVSKLIFSSSATVYGDPAELPLKESSRVGIGITNPYGWTKYMIERILQDIAKANPELSITILRYFNPVGAHESGTIGEDPAGTPNNLMPYVSQVAVGKRDILTINGNDYETPDGTCLRDYIHVVDLARGHVAALGHTETGSNIYNLGTGKAVSVLKVISEFEQACGHSIPYQFGSRRIGDVETNYADPSKAQKELLWEAKKSIADACTDSWRWQSQNPNGYSS